MEPAPTVHAVTVDLDTYVTRSYLFGGPWILMNRLPQMTTRDIAFATSETKLYKELRPKIRDGKVFHLTQPPARSDGSMPSSRITRLRTLP